MSVTEPVQASTTPPIEPPSVEEMIKSYDWDYNIALAVMKAESGGNSEAFNPEWHRNCQGSYGLFQMACIHSVNPAELFAPQININRAYQLYLKEGWRPWSVCTNGIVDCGLNKGLVE